MKKFFAALLIALFGAAPLFADDVADVKATLVNNLKLAVKGDFAGVLAVYTPDYLETTSDGKTIDYKQARRLVLALDGKHPEEFLLIAVSDELNGAEPTAEMMQKLREVANNPEFVKRYQAVLPIVIAKGKEASALQLKTLTFVTVKAEGNEAVAVIEYDSIDAQSGAIKHKINTVSLRKIDGSWKIYRSVVKEK